MSSVFSNNLILGSSRNAQEQSSGEEFRCHCHSFSSFDHVCTVRLRNRSCGSRAIGRVVYQTQVIAVVAAFRRHYLNESKRENVSLGPLATPSAGYSSLAKVLRSDPRFQIVMKTAGMAK
jgi:hypothetical protein